MNRPYRLVVSRSASRAIAKELPEGVAGAVIALITGPLVERPRAIGGELGNELTGLWSARRGNYRVVYRIDDARRKVTVLRIDHRRDVYRP